MIGRSRASRTSPTLTWGIHAHNDLGLAVANSLAAVAPGVRHVQGTINGYGERCGNANLVTILANLALKTDLAVVPAGRRRRELTDAVALRRGDREHRRPTTTRRTSAAPPSPTRAASTAPRSRRSSGAYQHVDPSLVGNERGSSCRELGGRANTRLRAEQLGHRARRRVDPRELSQAIKRARGRRPRVRGRRGFVRAAGPPPRSRLPAAVRGRRLHRARRAARRPRAAGRGDGQGRGRDGEVLHTAADGNGPVNALDAALRKALCAFYPELDAVHLVDYKVRILDGGAATAARTRVIIDSPTACATWSTMGQRHEHHRGLGGGAGRLARVRDLEDRCRVAPPRRTSAPQA